MDCPLQSESTAQVLLEYIAGRLNATSAADLERHLEICPECMRFRTEQTALWEALDSWETMPVSADFNRRLWQRIETSKTTPWRRVIAPIGSLAWKPAFPLAAAVLIMAAGFVLEQPGTQITPPGVPDAADVSISDADQVERALDDIQLLRQFDSVVLTSEAKGPNAM